MSRNFNGTSHHLKTTTVPVSAVPLSFSLWFNSDSITANQVICCISDTGSIGNYFAIELRGAEVGAEADAVAAVKRGTTFTQAFTTSTYSANTWHHAGATFSSGSSFAAYIDGGSKGTNTNAETPSGLDVLVLGVLSRTTDIAYFDGDLAEFGIWNVELTDNEMKMLAAGVSPLHVRPDSLVYYLPIHGISSPEVELSGGVNPATVTGATQSDHAPVAPAFYSGSVIPFPTVLVGGRIMSSLANNGGLAGKGGIAGIGGGLAG